MSDTVQVTKIPPCDVCKTDPTRMVTSGAAYDGKTVFGPWAFMCEAHFASHGVGLGTGVGQRLVLADDDDPPCGSTATTTGMPCGWPAGHGGEHQ